MVRPQFPSLSINSKGIKLTRIFIVILCISNLFPWRLNAQSDPDLDRIFQPDLAIQNSNDGLDDDDGAEEEEDDQHNANLQTSYIEQAFTNRHTFTCPLVKQLLATGTSGADLSPEDIDIVAAMGDAISTGFGLYNGKSVEFRGSAFTVGGDANIDGLVTFANILVVFNPSLEGMSHGIGSTHSLPNCQFNMAEIGAETDGMPEQAHRLIARLQKHYSLEELRDKWVMLFITVGSEELCAKCDLPNIKALRLALIMLRKSIPRIFVVLVGPVHISRYSQLNYNLLKPRCPCLSKISDQQLQMLQQSWNKALKELEQEFAQRHYQTFVFLALPNLRINSRHPEQLFIADKPLLNRKGHTYAAKWLWNRLITGPRYNVSNLPLSQESYFCPSLGCPYFRTPPNLQQCIVLTRSEYERLHATPRPDQNGKRLLGKKQIRDHLLLWIVVLLLLSTVTVFFFGTIFYCHGMKATKGRFESFPGV